MVLFLAGSISCTIQPDGEAISNDNIVIKYDVQGKGEPALVFIHGWCCDKSYWKYQVPEFSKNHKVVTIDLGGHGESGLDREKWTMEALKEVRIPIRSINSNRYPVNVEVNRKYAGSYDVKFMKRVGHFIMLEDPFTFNKLLKETIGEIMK